ncbi:MAG: uroporphyrinogen decarboxylase family protein, partial [Anaerolineales bacterium]
MRLMTDHLKQVADWFIDTFGAERVLPRIASPTDGLISPRMYERLVLPYRMELHQYVLDKGVKHIYDHICGDQNKLLPLLARLPWGDPGMLSFGHEVDLLKAAEIFPNEIICGNVEPAVIVKGTPDQVYEACRKNIEIGKQIKSGFVFMGGCDIPATVPPYHIYLMSKAAREFGQY